MMELEKRRPTENSDDPEDAAAYKQARDNVGDYKLKTAEDYVVPEAQRVTTKRKRAELLLLRKTVNYCNCLVILLVSAMITDTGQQE